MIDELAPGDEEQGDRMVVVTLVLIIFNIIIIMMRMMMMMTERKRGMVRSRMSTLCMFDESNLGFGSGRPDDYDDYCYYYEYKHDLH